MPIITSHVPAEGESIFGRYADPDYKIDHETGCWNWLKFRTKRGYASRHAHRLYWEAANGPIPEGWHVHHLCRNPSCVNPEHPEHLEAVSVLEHHVEHYIEEWGRSVDDIRAIRRRMEDVNTDPRELAKEYDIDFGAVYAIARGTRWVHLIGESGPVEIKNPRTCANPGCTNLVRRQRRDSIFCTVECRIEGNRRRIRERRQTNAAVGEQVR